MKKQLLTDTVTIRLAVVESNESGKLIAKGEFARANVATANRRIYPESLWKKNLNRLRRDLSERKVLGELDHPADGKTMLQRVSHVLTNLTIDDNGVVIGEAEILPGTDKGKQLKALLDAGIAVGVSSRGYGSVQENSDGVDVVQDDYHLMTFDFVADPANISSFPTFSTESDDQAGNLKEGEEASGLPDGGQVVEPSQIAEPVTNKEDEPKEMSDEEWKKQASNTSPQGIAVHAAVVNGRQVWVSVPEEDMKESHLSREEVQAQIMVAVQEAREASRAELMAELVSDPSSASAKAALESVKAILRPYVLEEDAEAALSAHDAKIGLLEGDIKDLAKLLASKESECEALTMACKDMGFNLYLHKTIGSHPRFESITSGLGRLTEIPSLERLKSLVSVHAQDAVRIRQETVESSKSRVVQLESKVATLSKDLKESQSACDIALKASVEASARVLLERKIVCHPQAAQIRATWEVVKTTGVKEIVGLVESFTRSPSVTPTLVESVQTVLRRRGMPKPSMVEDALKGTTGRGMNTHLLESITGAQLDEKEFDALSGLKS